MYRFFIEQNRKNQLLVVKDRQVVKRLDIKHHALSIPNAFLKRDGSVMQVFDPDFTTDYTEVLIGEVSLHEIEARLDGDNDEIHLSKLILRQFRSEDEEKN